MAEISRATQQLSSLNFRDESSDLNQERQAHPPTDTIDDDTTERMKNKIRPLGQCDFRFQYLNDTRKTQEFLQTKLPTDVKIIDQRPSVIERK